MPFDTSNDMYAILVHIILQWAVDNDNSALMMTIELNDDIAALPPPPPSLLPLPLPLLLPMMIR